MDFHFRKREEPGREEAPYKKHMRPSVVLCALLFMPKIIAESSSLSVPGAMRRAPGVRPHRMSKWIVHGGRLETQGLVGEPSSSVAEQTRQILAKLDTILSEAGSKREDLIHIDIWLKDIEGDGVYDAMNLVYDEYMAAIPLAMDGSGTRQLPTRVCVGAALSGGFAVELRASAACRPLEGGIRASL